MVKMIRRFELIQRAKVAVGVDVLLLPSVVRTQEFEAAAAAIPPSARRLPRLWLTNACQFVACARIRPHPSRAWRKTQFGREPINCAPSGVRARAPFHEAGRIDTVSLSTSRRSCHTASKSSEQFDGSLPER